MSSTSILDAVWDGAQSTISQIKGDIQNIVSHRIPRVSQLDSELLDQELAELLQQPVAASLSVLDPAFKSHFEPELNLIIQLAIYKLSVWNLGASYGAKLQGLRYTTNGKLGTVLAPSRLPRKTLLLHGTLTLILPYLHGRLRSFALSRAWPDAPSSDTRRKIWHLMDLTESWHTSLGLVNFIAFLWAGRYRTLADRVLRMSLVPAQRSLTRDVSYEFMNRQMVWHAFTEFLLFLLPLTNARTIRRRVHSLVSSTFEFLSSTVPRGILTQKSIKASGPETSRKSPGKYWSLSVEQCALCAEAAALSSGLQDFSSPAAAYATSSALEMEPRSLDLEPTKYPLNIPYQTNCGHLYCYHCVADRLLHLADEGDDSGWECLRCNEPVKDARRYSVDALDSEVSESDYEFSSDLDLGTDLSGSMGTYSESGYSE